MSAKTEDSQRVNCPFCAEKIMPEALICPFCRSKLVGEDQLPLAGKKPLVATEKPPGVLRVMVFNLLCPGMGAWKLGHRARGAIIFCVITACITIYAGQIMPQIQKKVALAMRTGNVNELNSLEAELSGNPLLDISFYLYLLSFVDAYFLVANATKVAKPGDKA